MLRHVRNIWSIKYVCGEDFEAGAEKVGKLSGTLHSTVQIMHLRKNYPFKQNNFKLIWKNKYYRYKPWKIPWIF